MSKELKFSIVEDDFDLSSCFNSAISETRKVCIAQKENKNIDPPISVVGLHRLKPETQTSINRIRDICFPAIHFFEMKKASLIDQGCVCDIDGNILKNTIAPHILERFLTDYDKNLFTYKKTQQLGGTTLILPLSSPSLSHFIFEGLSYLAGGLPKIDQVVVTTTFQQAFVELIEMQLGQNIKIHFRKPEDWSEMWSMERVILPEYNFTVHPWMNSLAEKIHKKFGTSIKNRESIYVSRSDALRYRILLNEDKIENLLSKKGFEIVVLSKMTETEKIAKFANAKIIVGPLGAGLYNCIFSPSSTKVVALCAPNYLRSFMEQCIAIRDQKRSYCFGPGFISFEPEQQGGNNDFIVSEQDVLRAIKEPNIYEKAIYFILILYKKIKTNYLVRRFFQNIKTKIDFLR